MTDHVTQAELEQWNPERTEQQTGDVTTELGGSVAELVGQRESFGPERERELAQQASGDPEQSVEAETATDDALAESGRYERGDGAVFEAEVGEGTVTIYNIYGSLLREVSYGTFRMRVQMGVLERVGDGRHV